MTEKPFSIISTIICDDVRKEDNGKEILIGIFNDTMVIGSVPAVLATFGIRFLVKTNTKEVEIKGYIIGPGKNKIVEFGGKAVFANIRFSSSISFKISPMMISEYGEYEIYLGLNSEPEKVHAFNVITPEQMNAA
jgi:uncharacterized protein DUF6941